MRKFLLPLLSLVNIVLLAVVFGVAAQCVGTRVDGSNFGNYYQLVFQRGQNVFALLSFIFLCAGAVLVLFNLIPSKARKVSLPLNAAFLIASGVLMLLSIGKTLEKVSISGSLIAISVLMMVAGLVTLMMSVIEFTKKASK